MIFESGYGFNTSSKESDKPGRTFVVTQTQLLLYIWHSSSANFCMKCSTSI